MQPITLNLIAAPAAARPRVRSTLVAGLIVLAVSLFATSMLMPNAGNAQDVRVVKSMEALKADTAKLGAPKIEGTEVVGGKDAPALYFGADQRCIGRCHRRLLRRPQEVTPVAANS
jgi:hypothetical protein